MEDAMKTIFKNGDPLVPELINALNNPRFSVDPQEDGEIPFPKIGEVEGLNSALQALANSIAGYQPVYVSRTTKSADDWKNTPFNLLSGSSPVLPASDFTLSDLTGLNSRPYEAVINAELRKVSGSTARTATLRVRFVQSNGTPIYEHIESRLLGAGASSSISLRLRLYSVFGRNSNGMATKCYRYELESTVVDHNTTAPFYYKTGCLDPIIVPGDSDVIFGVDAFWGNETNPTDSGNIIILYDATLKKLL